MGKLQGSERLTAELKEDEVVTGWTTRRRQSEKLSARSLFWDRTCQNGFAGWSGTNKRARRQQSMNSGACGRGRGGETSFFVQTKKRFYVLVDNQLFSGGPRVGSRNSPELLQHTLTTVIPLTYHASCSKCSHQDWPMQHQGQTAARRKLGCCTASTKGTQTLLRYFQRPLPVEEE